MAQDTFDTYMEAKEDGHGEFAIAALHESMAYDHALALVEGKDGLTIHNFIPSNYQGS